MALQERGVAQFCTLCYSKSLPDGSGICPRCNDKGVPKMKEAPDEPVDPGE